MYLKPYKLAIRKLTMKSIKAINKNLLHFLFTKNILFKKNQKSLKSVSKVTCINNDTSLYFSKHRPLFWFESYPIMTNSSLSISIEFNTSLLKHFNIINNLDTLILNENFHFSDIFERFEYSNSTYENINNYKPSHSTTINNSTKSNPRLQVINALKTRVLLILKRNQSLNSSVTYPLLKRLLNMSFTPKSFIYWKLLSNFYSKNTILTKLNTINETRIGQVDRFTLNINTFDADEYTLRLYDNYNSLEFIKNNTSLINKFTSDYEFNKGKIRLSFHRNVHVLDNKHFFSESNNLSDSVYSHYFSSNNFSNLHLILKPSKLYSKLFYTKQLYKYNHKYNLLKHSNIYNLPKTPVLIPLYNTYVRSSIITKCNPFYLLNHKNYILTNQSLNPNKYNLSEFKYSLQHIFTTPKDGNLETILPFNSNFFIFLNYTYDNFLKISNDLYTAGYKHNNTTSINTVEETNYNIISKSGSSFIIQHIGLFLHFKLFWFKPKFDNFKFKFKKKIFSFYKTNEIKKTLMENRKSLSIFKYIDSRNWFFNKRTEHDYSNYNLNLDFYLKKQLELKSISSLKFKHSSYISNLCGYNRSTSDIGYTDSLKKITLDPKYRQLEVRIPRIRFNPGYQRLWREYRLALANAIRFKYIYQQQLTRHLVKFYSCLRSYNILALEYKIWKVIIYSRLLPDLHIIKDFINNSLIFLNGQTLKNENYIIVVNDIVQIQVSIWYYIYYKWLTSWNNLRIKKFKKLVYRKKIAGSYTIIKSLKQKSRYTPSYIYNMRFDMSDTKSYLEIDYFTLSFIFIYDSFILDFNSADDFPEMRHYVYKMYNWKYIN